VIIAVDGPAAAGKGTIARALAQHFGYHFLDTGTLYRRVGLALLETSDDPRNVKAAVAIAQNLNSHPYSDLELRTEAVGAAASIVAVIPEVRTALLAYQRNFADQLPSRARRARYQYRCCPDADVKLLSRHLPRVRARRRLAELKSYGADVSFDVVLADIRQRDERDRTAPLPPRSSRGRVIIDTSEMTVEEAIAAAIKVASSVG
jgi:cytidylate kinase